MSISISRAACIYASPRLHISTSPHLHVFTSCPPNSASLSSFTYPLRYPLPQPRPPSPQPREWFLSIPSNSKSLFKLNQYPTQYLILISWQLPPPLSHCNPQPGLKTAEESTTGRRHICHLHLRIPGFPLSLSLPLFLSPRLSLL